MNSESAFIIEFWTAVRDHLPAARRSDIATALIAAAADYGWDAGDLGDILGEDDLLTDAFEEVFDIEEDFEDGYEDE